MKKRFISFALLMAILTSLYVPAYAVQIKSFSDVEKGHWAENAIMLCVQHGAVNGTKTPDENGVGEFDPKGTVTLGTFFAILTRLVAKDYITGVPAEGESWSMPYYNAAVNSGMIKEKDFHIARLDMPINREDMSYLLVNAAKLNGEKLEINELAESNIKDFGKVSTDRKECVLQAYSNGLITGYDGNMFGPEDTMTREQMAMVVCRLMKYAPRAQVKFEEKKPANTDYFYTDGMVKTETQIAVVKENFNNIRLYKNGKNELCVDISTVSFPEELNNAGWELSIGIHLLNEYGYMNGEGCGFSLKSGESVSGYIATTGNSRQGYETIKVSDSNEVFITMSLSHKNYTDAVSRLSFKSVSNITDVITGVYDNSSSMKNENIYMDISSVYKDLGLK